MSGGSGWGALCFFGRAIGKGSKPGASSLAPRGPTPNSKEPEMSKFVPGSSGHSENVFNKVGR